MDDILNQKGTTTTCATAIITKDNKILLGLRHYDHKTLKKISLWTTPGGRCDDGEHIEQTLLREIREEIDIDDIELKSYLGMIKGVKQGDDVHLFHCTTSQEPSLMEPHKFSEWCWFSKEEIPENFINPETLKIVHKILE